MEIRTKYFGTFSIEESKIIHFEEGILGFHEYKEYILLGQEEDSPFCWLQSVENGDLAFALVDPTVICPDYEPKVAEEQLVRLGDIVPGSLLVYAIVTVPEKIQNMTANLMAPIIIHIHTQKGAQLITEEEKYPIRYKIFDTLHKEEKGVSGC